MLFFLRPRIVMHGIYLVDEFKRNIRKAAK